MRVVSPPTLRNFQVESASCRWSGLLASQPRVLACSSVADLQAYVAGICTPPLGGSKEGSAAWPRQGFHQLSCTRNDSSKAYHEEARQLVNSMRESEEGLGWAWYSEESDHEDVTETQDSVSGSSIMLSASCCMLLSSSSRALLICK